MRAHHGPGHHGHAPGDVHAGSAASERAMGFAALLTGGFMLIEAAGGLVSGSLALLADAGHMLTDVAALALAWFALRLRRRPGSWRRTYGFDRASVLAAFVNGLALFGLAAWILWEAVQRLRDPGEVLGGVMLAVAAAGLVVNLVALRILSGGGQSLNERAAVLHVTGDLLGSVAAIAAAVAILATGWTPADPLLSVLVAGLILRAAWRIVAESAHILLEGVPPGLDPRAVAADLVGAVAGVTRVHHVHAWSIAEDRPMITLEAEVAPEADAEAARRAIKARLRERFGTDHATVEVTRAG
jgi:cobalt-zinc-cadmium efflux system protein